MELQPAKVDGEMGGAHAEAAQLRRRYAILGSCVSSDIFRLHPDLGELVAYHGRSSMLSMMSSPVEFRGDDFVWSSNFARRTIEADFQKTFFADLEASRCDFLIVDFVDERWDLLRLGDSFVTLSADLMKAGVEHLIRRGFRRVSRYHPEI